MTHRPMRRNPICHEWAVVALALSAWAAPAIQAQEPGGNGPFVRFQAEDRAAGDHFACALDLAGDGLGTPAGVTLLTGSLHDDDLGAQSGSAYVFEPDAAGTGLQQAAKLLAPDGGAGDLMGFSVALSRDGGRALAGAPGGPRSEGRGAAYLFERSRSGAWAFAARLGAAGVDDLGSAVLFVKETPTAGAPGTADGRGAVVLFGPSGGEIQRLQPQDLRPGDGFGWALAADGSRLAVGAPWSDAPFTDAGAVHVFEGGPGSLVRTVRITAPTPGPFESFGYSVALSGDLLAVGAPRSDTAGGAGAGSVYVFRLTGAAAVLEARLDGSAAGDQFGTSLSFSGGASPTLAVGVRRAGASDVGAVDLFRRQGGAWASSGRLQPAGARAGDELGIDVALAPAGVAIGAYLDDGGGTDAGSVYVRVLRVEAPASADLVLEKSSTASRPSVAGTAVEYRLRVFNRGPGDAVGARVLDALPAGLLGATWTCRGRGGGSCSVSGTGSIDDRIDLPAGAEALYRLSATIDPAATGEVVNRASVEPPSALADPDASSDSDRVTIPVVRRSDLAISFGAESGPSGGAPVPISSAPTSGQGVAAGPAGVRLHPGEIATEEIRVVNQGPSDVAGATVYSELAVGLAAVDWTCAPGAGAACSPSGSGLLDDTVDLAAGAEVVYQLRVVARAGFLGRQGVAAVVAAPAPGVDLEPSNDRAARAGPVLLPGVGELGLTKSVSGIFVEGGSVSYEILVASARSADLSDEAGHEVIDPIPGEIEALSVVADQGAAAIDADSFGAPTVVWDGALAAGDVVTITIEGKIRPGARGKAVSNQAVLAIPSEDFALLSAPPGGPDAVPTVFTVVGPLAVPAASPWGLAALVLVLAAVALGLLRRLS